MVVHVVATVATDRRNMIRIDLLNHALTYTLSTVAVALFTLRPFPDQMDEVAVPDEANGRCTCSTVPLTSSTSPPRCGVVRRRRPRLMNTTALCILSLRLVQSHAYAVHPVVPDPWREEPHAPARPDVA